MPVLKLTQASLKTIPRPPASKQVLYFDSDLKGFGLLVSGKTDSRAFIVQRSLPGGKTRRITIGRTSFLSVEEARNKAKKFIAKFYEGCDPKEELQRFEAERKTVEARQQAEEKKLSFTLQYALDQYLKNSRLKPGTAKSYRAFVEKNLVDWLRKPLREITRDMVIERHSYITEQVPLRSKHNPFVKGHGMANGVMRILRALWNDARERVPELPENPVRNLRRMWHPEIRRTSHVRPSEMPKFYEAIQKLPVPMHRHFILLLMFTGLRRNEAAGLSWDEVDFDNRIIRLPANRTKASRPLDLPMSDFVHDILREREKPGREGNLVFAAVKSKSGHLEEPKGILDELADLSGVKVSCHDLRRTFITTAESCEISPFALKGLVNHSYGQDVTAGYIVSGAERLRKPMEQITAKLLVLMGLQRTSNQPENGA